MCYVTVSSTVSGLEYLASTVHRDPAKSKLVGVNLGCQPAPLSRSRLQAPMASSSRSQLPGPATLRRWAPDLGATVRQRSPAFPRGRWDRYSVSYSTRGEPSLTVARWHTSVMRSW